MAQAKAAAGDRHVAEAVVADRNPIEWWQASAVAQDLAQLAGEGLGLAGIPGLGT
jgi:hypothetical protein